MTTIARYNRPERVQMWSCRFFIKLGTRDIVPVLAKDEGHVIELLWKAHKEWLCSEVDESLETVPEKARRILIRKHCEIRKLSDGIWATQDYISNDIMTQTE